jgi:DNA-binding transcriptional LysR family regulator
MAMEHRQLRYFVAVAEELNFSRAARRLNISQPPISAQIKALEDELGTQLFERDNRSVTLTKAGHVLLLDAREILQRIASAAESTRRAGRGEAGKLVVSFSSSVPLHDDFASTMRSFRQKYPDVEIEARCLATTMQLSGLLAEEIDACFVRPPYWYRPPATIELTKLWSDRLELFLPSDHRLANESHALPIEAARDENFVTVVADMGCGLYEQTVMMCMAAGFRPNVLQHVSTSNSILSLIAAGSGVGVLPSCRANANIGGISHRPIDGSLAESSIYLATRKGGQNSLIRNFVDVAQPFSQSAAA